jgi:hypothetical protein
MQTKPVPLVAIDSTPGSPVSSHGQSFYLPMEIRMHQGEERKVATLSILAHGGEVLSLLYQSK